MRVFAGISQKGVLIWRWPHVSWFWPFAFQTCKYRGANNHHSVSYLCSLRMCLPSPGYDISTLAKCRSILCCDAFQILIPKSLTPSSSVPSFIFYINQFRNTRTITQNFNLFFHSIPIPSRHRHKSNIPIHYRKQNTIRKSVSFTQSLSRKDTSLTSQSQQ